MIKILSLGLVVLSSAVALAQSPPRSPTFNKLKLEDGKAFAVPHVRSTADLKTLVPGASGDTVYRDGFAAAGDGGGVTYKWSGASCSLNAGAGDDGSQIKPNTGSGCWTAVFPAERDIRVFGAVDDCVTDTTAALNKALASLPATGGTIVFPAAGTGCYAFASAIAIGDGSASAKSTKQNVVIKSALPVSGSVPSIVATPTSTVTFKYTGAAQINAFVTVNGPMVWAMDGIQLDCTTSFKCNIGLMTRHMFQSRVQNVSVINWRTTGIREDAYPVLPPGVYIGASNNSWKNIFVSSTATGVYGTAFDIGISSCTMPNCFDVSTGNYEDLTLQVSDIAGGGSILLRGADNLVFKNVFTYQISDGHVGQNAWGVYVLPPTGNASLPSEITFIGSPLVGGIFGAANWACDAHGAKGIVFMPINEGDMANPATGGKPIPSSWNGNQCIHGFTSSGSLLDAYQTRMLYGGVQYYGTSTIIRDMTTRTVTSSAAATTLSTGTLPAGIMRAYSNPNGITNKYDNDRKLRIHVAGLFRNNTGSAQTIRYQLVIGGVSICDTGALSVPNSAFYGAWTLDATFSIKNGGSTTSYLDGTGSGVSTGGSLAAQFADCRFELGGTASATNGAMIAGTTVLKSAYDTYGLNMANAQTLATQVILQSASSSLLLTQNQLAVELQ